MRTAGALAAVALLAVILYNATAVDRIPPTVTIQLSSTAKGSDLARTTASIDVVFNEDVKHTLAESAFSITPAIAGSFNWQGSRELIFTPSQKLPLGATFHVHMKAGVEDLAGNVQSSPSDMAFSVVTAPVVTAIAPSAGQQAVPVNSTIKITFDRLMETAKVLSGLQVEPAIAYQPAWNGQVLTLTPSKPLAFGTKYTVSIGTAAVDTDGSPLARTYQASFTTIGVGLHTTSVAPTPNVAGVSVRSEISVVFDGSIDPASIADSIQLTPPAAGDTKATSLPNDTRPIAQPTASPAAEDNVLVFTPSQPLAAHTTYTVSLKAVRRTDGEAAEGRTWSFTTGEAPTTAQNQVVFLSDRSGVRNVWLMNADGTNPREVTAELVPVSGFDVSGDGSKIVYGAGGIVKRMSIGGGDLTTVTAGNRFEYAPLFTPDATAVIVGRRDQNGADQGYWRVPIVSGADEQQLVPDGAPGLGSVALAGDGLTDAPGVPSWAPRAAFSEDGKLLLIVRGSDSEVELVDTTGAATPRKLGLVAQGPPVWVQSQACFFVVATPAGGSTPSYWRVPLSGDPVEAGAAVGGLAAASNGGLSMLVPDGSGVAHVSYAASASGQPVALTSGETWSDRSPSFSPDGSAIVFGRVAAATPTTSAGIWVIRSDGSGLTNITTDGGYPRWLP